MITNTYRTMQVEANCSTAVVALHTTVKRGMFLYPLAPVTRVAREALTRQMQEQVNIHSHQALVHCLAVT